MRLSLDLWYGWIAAGLICLGMLLMQECTIQPAHAQLSLDLKGGVAFPFRTTQDGTYIQDPYPHNTKFLTGAYGAGLSYAFTPELSVQAHVLNLGSSRIQGRAVSDERYDFKHGRCTAKCNDTYGFRATDSLKGGDLTVTYTWQRDGVQPFVKGGIAIFQHQAIFRNEDGTEDRFTGLLHELELGAGLAYQWAYVEMDYFQGMNFGGQNLPISTQQVAMFAGVKVGL